MNLKSRAELCDYIDRGGQVSYLFFLGHQPNLDSGVGKACLSQWFDAPFSVDGILYPTAEHFMMAEKARLFVDLDALARVLAADNPGLAKAVGRDVLGFDEDKWIAHRMRIVIEANYAKFSQNGALRDFLLSTGQSVLIEARLVDCIWGIGLTEDDPTAKNPHQWNGLNLLGFALMQVRERLQMETAF